jgi:hypothetical protein
VKYEHMGNSIYRVRSADGHTLGYVRKVTGRNAASLPADVWQYRQESNGWNSRSHDTRKAAAAALALVSA